MGDNSEDVFDVFFSYHWRDHQLVEGVARALTARGLRVFLDRWYLTPGLPWPQALERALASCKSVAVFLGADGLGPWQQRERDLALDRQARDPGFPVIPVLLTRTDPALGFLKLNTWVDLSENVARESALDALVAAVGGRLPGASGPQAAADLKASICPYRGLHPFREEDAAFFYGREAFTAKLIAAIAGSSLVAVVGASGSGKSSVVRAGLIPQLRKTNGPVWEIATVVPNDRPLHSLAATLVQLLEPESTPVDRLAEINKLAAHLAEGSVALRDVAAEIVRAQRGTDRLLLVVDQWEELYTLATDEDASRRFIAEILDASAHGPVTVVLTLRGDFFGRALSDRSLADRLQNAQVNLGPMTRDELARSMTGPAAELGLEFEPGLVDRILLDVGQEPGHLPLLEFVLTTLWEQRRGNLLHHDAYASMGGIDGAIAARADLEFARLSDDQKVLARRMLIQMVRPGEEAEDTRQRTVIRAGNDAALMVIQRLADARLLVTARDPASGLETVEVTHEALIRHWALLRTWVDEDREFLRSRARIEAAAALWEKDRRDPSRLLSAGRALEEAQELLASRRDDLDPLAIAFIDASGAAASRAVRRRTILKNGAAVGTLLALASAYLYWDLRIAEHEEFYNAYAKRWGVFEGVGRVSASEARTRSRTLRFVRKGRLGPVILVEAIDGTGSCARGGLKEAAFAVMDVFKLFDEPTRPCTVKWEPDGQGRLNRQTFLDSRNRPIFSLIYTDEERLRAELKGPTGLALPNVATTVTYKRIDSGANEGQDSLEQYSDASGQPRPFVFGLYGQSTEYNLLGLVVRMKTLDKDGKPAQIGRGFAEVRIEYDGTGSPVKLAMFDERGLPVSGIAGWKTSYDANGNPVKLVYFDGREKPVRTGSGYASISLEYDALGRETTRAFFDEAGQPTPNEEGYPKIVRELDRAGRPIAQAYFDELGKPLFTNDGYASLARQYDEFNNPVEEAYFDHEGKPTRIAQGYAKIKRDYDDRGRLTRTAYFDQADKPTLSKKGYAQKLVSYDHRGQPTVEAYFDEAGKPSLSSDGYAKRVLEYDAAGHVVSESYFDESDKPVLSKDGYAKLLRHYDQAGREVERSYLDQDEKPTLSKEWYAKTTMSYDAVGNLIAEAYLDDSGRPTLSKDGYARVSYDYDQQGHKIGIHYFDEAGRPTLENACRCATEKNIYDARGLVKESSYFDEAGQPTYHPDRYARIVFEHDGRGRATKVTSYDANGKPTLRKDQYAILTRAYNARGKVTEESYFDDSGKATLISSGYAKVAIAYDERGRETEHRYFDEQSKPKSHNDGNVRVVRSYDERGNVTVAAYFDDESKPIRIKDGYARITQVYDARGNLVEEAYFDEAGSAVRSKSGCAKKTNSYDSRGNLTKIVCYDEAGRVHQDTDGVAILIAEHDVRGNAIKVDFLNGDGKPARAKNGHAGWRKSYDPRGKTVEVTYVDDEGRPTRNREDGYARFTRAYDARGNLVKEAYFDENEKATRSSQGYASFTRGYDLRGNVVDEAYFDERAKPVVSKDGYARFSKSYDARGEVVRQVFFDANGRVIRSPKGSLDSSRGSVAAQ